MSCQHDGVSTFFAGRRFLIVRVSVVMPNVIVLGVMAPICGFRILRRVCRGTRPLFYLIDFFDLINVREMRKSQKKFFEQGIKTIQLGTDVIKILRP
jgi:hypothetical protein